MRSDVTIALVSFDSLGDSLIYLMMSENLYRNGFNLTVYSRILFQLRHWLPHLTIKDYPEDYDIELNDYHFVIFSPPQKVRDCMDEQVTDTLKKKWLLLCQNAPAAWQYDLTNSLKSKLSKETFESLVDLSTMGHSIRYKKFLNESVVEMTLAFMREKMKLVNVTKWPALSAPSQLMHRNYQHRIVVSPDSSTPDKKNWTPTKFIRLCRALRRDGYSPIIVVSPNNYSYWQTLNNGEFDMPKFNNIADLAAFIFESGVVVANDSGNGHLASVLNVPVVTIYRKRNPNFHWRPDWLAAKVICPMFTFYWRGQLIWRPFITVTAVRNAIKSVLKNPK